MDRNRLALALAVGSVAWFVLLGPAAASSFVRSQQTIVGVRLPEAESTDDVTYVSDPIHDAFSFAYLIKSKPDTKQAVVGVNFPAMVSAEITPPIGPDSAQKNIQIEMNWLVPNRGPSGVSGFQIDYQTQAGSVYRSKLLKAIESEPQAQFSTYCLRTKQEDFQLIEGSFESLPKIVALSVRYRPTENNSSRTIYLQGISIKIIEKGTTQISEQVMSEKGLAGNEEKFRVK